LQQNFCYPEKSLPMNLKRYFDRVVLINLKRRPDRLARTKLALEKCHWPFRQPEIFAAVDGKTFPPRPDWKASPGAWGCLQSHHQIVSKAIRDGVKRLLILEDDIFFTNNFSRKVQHFLKTVPDDWDQLMLGGEHNFDLGQPVMVVPGVVRCVGCERTHCYAIRGPFMRKLAKRWMGGGKYDGTNHCDWIMSRDPEMQSSHKVYAPQYFLVGQDREENSDIMGTGQPRRIWNPPQPDLHVINLHAPSRVVSGLRNYGFCTGDGLHSRGDFGKKLVKLFAETKGNISQRVERLRKWIVLLQWELAVERSMICTVWHPQATPELVRAASHWPVHEIRALSINDALRQLPPKLRALYGQRQASNPLGNTGPLYPRKGTFVESDKKPL
jgi:hypothetical protein